VNSGNIRARWPFDKCVAAGRARVYDDWYLVGEIRCQTRLKISNSVPMDGLKVVGDGGEKASRAWMRALERTTPIGKHPTRTLPTVIAELAATQGDAQALLSERENFTYRALTERANQYSRWALAAGLAKGDVVCLLMPNRPEYLAIWLGLTRVGGVVALLNTNLAGVSLAHCVNLVKPKHIIVAAELSDTFSSARLKLENGPKIWMHGARYGKIPNIESELQQHAGAALKAGDAPEVSIDDPALYIYTSGTTGLPKAATVSHHRIMNWSFWFGGMMDTRKSDRMYDCLPLYHSVGGVVAVGAVLAAGGSVVIRERFSASQFWNDVVQSECTLFQYIGELCRYLVNSEISSDERKHRIRLACGNGLRPDVWESFKDRFRIPQILEFYAATEGNFSLYNAEGEPGAIGRIPPFLVHRLPVALVKFDFERGEPARDVSGLCVQCSADEPGEAIGKIPGERSNIFGRFEGYTNKQESEKKILRNVFKPGDAWFRTGDLMRKDKRGFFYFVDRIGDTFRWKGENVATSEVAEALTDYPGLVEANVYGVAVPGADGRAGMASIIVNDKCDLSGLRQHLNNRLPQYARPLFVRILSQMDVTATFKHKKTDLVQEGFDPKTTNDPIFFYDKDLDGFVRVDNALHQRITSGQVRL
jgi:fatty-acyl-CoA synthase